MEKKNIGSSFDSWLREEGIQEPVAAAAIKRVRARQNEAIRKEDLAETLEPTDGEAPSQPAHPPRSQT